MVYKKIILIFLLFFLFGCSKYVSKTDYTNSLIIEKINFKENINISSINDYVYGVVLFSEYGRPDIDNSNTIIGAHSGTGSNAYFNLLEKLEIKDKITLIYNEKKYLYEVEKIITISENNLDPIKNINYNILTLMTCKIGDSSKRIIVVSKLISVIWHTHKC